jgi:hypothetical protein
MSQNHSVTTNDYGIRIIERKAYLPQEIIRPEMLMLLGELLTLSPRYESKKPVSAYADGKLLFSVTCLGQGYVLSGRLTQTQTSDMTFLFSNPYVKAFSILQDTFALGFVASEDSLRKAKDSLLAKLELLRTSPLRKVKSVLKTIDALPDFNPDLIPTLTLDDELLAAKTLSEATVGSSLYLGPKNKRDILNRGTSFASDLSQVSFLESAGFSDNVTSDFFGEAIGLVFEIPELKTREDHQKVTLCLLALEKTLEDRFHTRFGTDVVTSHGFISRRNAVIFLTCPTDRFSSLSDLLPWKPFTKQNVDCSAYFAEARNAAEVGRIQRAANPEAFLSEMEESVILGLSETPFSDAIDDATLSTLLSSFVFLGAARALKKKGVQQ